MVPASAPPAIAKGSMPGSADETPAVQQVSAASPQPAAQNLVSKGDILLKSGDLAMARQFYERAYAEGARASAAMGTARTFDPVVYAQLKVQGMQPDPQQALEWYERARAEGNPQAAAAIDALKKTAP
jgi:TPR repeat protein